MKQIFTSFLMVTVLAACGHQGSAPSQSSDTTTGTDDAVVSTFACKRTVGGIFQGFTLRTFTDGHVEGSAGVSQPLPDDKGTIEPWNGTGSVHVAFEGTEYIFSQSGGVYSIDDGATVYQFQNSDCFTR